MPTIITVCPRCQANTGLYLTCQACSYPMYDQKLQAAWRLGYESGKGFDSPYPMIQTEPNTWSTGPEDTAWHHGKWQRAKEEAASRTDPWCAPVKFE